MRVEHVQVIVPRLPPSICGVGDYAINLARQLRKDFNIVTSFIVCDPKWRGPKKIDGFLVRQLLRCSVSSLNLSLTNDPVLLHYSNYGYQKRGCPLWLLKGLSQWKNHKPLLHLTIMYHEVYSFGPPWRSSFWLSLVQRTLAVRLCKLSDSCITNMNMYADKLIEWDRSKIDLISALPVFSTIGEPNHVSLLSERKRRMVVFGGKRLRTRVYTTSLSKLKTVCQALNIQEVVDIGPELDFCLPKLDVPLVVMGKRKSCEISQIMLNSWVGFLDYFPGYLAKSSIFASYCAHGMIPICAEYNSSERDGIISDWNYLVSDSDIQYFSKAQFQEVAKISNDWYAKHNLKQQAKIFASKLMGHNL